MVKQLVQGAAVCWYCSTHVPRQLDKAQVFIICPSPLHPTHPLWSLKLIPPLSPSALFRENNLEISTHFAKDQSVCTDLSLIQPHYPIELHTSCWVTNSWAMYKMTNLSVNIGYTVLSGYSYCPSQMYIQVIWCTCSQIDSGDEGNWRVNLWQSLWQSDSRLAHVWEGSELWTLLLLEVCGMGRGEEITSETRGDAWDGVGMDI